MKAEVALDNIRRLDNRLGAIAQVFDQPLEAAATGGLVAAVKDLIDVAGRPTGGGGLSPLEEAPVHHAVAVQRLLANGWTVIGKTHCVELAYGSCGTNRVTGTPWNPWDAGVHRIPGGSSSGSAVAVAAGFCDMALGGDTGGSVRVPAAFCGVVGLKPGMGLVDATGVQPLSLSLDVVGPLARDVTTAAKALAAISGVGSRFHLDQALSTSIHGSRIAAIPLEALEGLEPRVAEIYLQAVHRFRAHGVTIVEDCLPRSLDDYSAIAGRIMSAEGWRTWSDHIHNVESAMDPWIVARLRAGESVSDSQLATDHLERKQDQRDFDGWMASYDGVILPTCPQVAPPLNEVTQDIVFSTYTRAANYLDLPAASVPCGVTATGLPIGLQIISPRADEDRLVSLALGFEAVSGWDGRRPSLEGFERGAWARTRNVQ